MAEFPFPQREPWEKPLFRKIRRVAVRMMQWQNRRKNRKTGGRLPHIAVYCAFGHARQLSLSGRVLFNDLIRLRKGQTAWSHFLNTMREFWACGMPDVPVKISAGDFSMQLQTDEEGFFHADCTIPADPPTPDFNIELLQTSQVQTARFFSPPPQAALGIITDIDDTILHTHLHTPFRWKAAYATLFQHTDARKMVEGASQFLQSLSQRGGQAPVFYVSNSPWNLFDLLDDFLSFHHFPAGPMLLRDWRPGQPEAGPSPMHKYPRIERLLAIYPDLPFILIGDNGEADAQIYRTIREKYPSRIRAILIREVSAKLRKAAKSQIEGMPHADEIHWIQSFEEAQTLAEEKNWWLTNASGPSNPGG